MNERLRQVSQILGIALPVYVLFTKLDTVPAFAEYAANLTQAEVAIPVGSMLAAPETGAGLYAERAAQQIGTRFDEVAYLLSEFRLELLGRGGEAPALAKSYEFPRDLRKLRAGIVDFLVEVARPSQIGVNPFLRGFFFSGMRAHIVEDVLSVGAQSAPTPAFDAGATRVFSFASAQAAAPTPAARRSTRKVAQWAFLPYLFTNLVLTDKTALDSSRASTKVSGVKRVLIACLCAVLGLYLILLTISFFHNRDLEQRAAAATLPVPMVTGKDAVASVADLQTLDQLRQLLVQLDGYHKNGEPLSYRWGLYRGEDVRLAACRAYGTRFTRLLLAQTQANIVVKLSGLPAKAAPTDEYQASYKPLKAWLITTSNPERSSDFLPPVLEQEWIANRIISPETQQLAQDQFDYYAVALLQTPTSCLASLNGARPDAQVVANTRAYLNSFAGIDHVYLSMKAVADRRFSAIEFKRLYPNSVRYVAAPTIVDGAFSKEGFTFMQDAIKHPDQYLSGEEWVTGPPTATIDRTALAQQLPTRYQADFLNVWRTFLRTAHVLPFSGFDDAAAKLHELDGPASPLLAILGVVSRNTAVNQPAFAQPFQAPQSIVPPGNGPGLPTPVNPGYTDKLSAIEQAIKQMLAAPGTKDPAPVNAAVTPAFQTVSALRGGFQPPDPAGIADAATERLLTEPIHHAGDLAGKAPIAGANGAGADFCKASSGVLGKFPFNPDAKEDVSPEDAAAYFSPTGTLAKFVADQSKLIAFNGTLYTSASPIPVNPALLNFLNTAHSVAAILFPTGNAQPQISFTIAQEKSPNLSPATLEVDGATFANVGVPNRVSWQYRPQGTVKLAGSGQTKNTFGPWSIFHFAYAAKHPAPNQLEYIFQNNGITEKTPTGADIIYRFYIEDTGARLLNPDFMRRQLHCVATVAVSK